jgi:hypothetical protein
MNDDPVFCKVLAAPAPARFLDRGDLVDGDPRSRRTGDLSDVHPFGGRVPRWPRG